MKRSNLILTSMLGVAMMYACSGGGNADSSSDESTTDQTAQEVKTHGVDLTASTVNWEGTMMGMYSHTGTLAIKEGQLETTGNEITGGSFVFDMTSITPTDENYSDEKPKEKLVAHLSSDDFFAVSEFPTAKFEITGPAENGLKGNLTIRGNTHEEMVSDLSFNPDSSMATGKVTFDRTKYDVSFKHPAQEMVLSNDIEVGFTLKLK